MLVHLFAAAWIAGMLAFAHGAPDRYAAAMQEDRVVEWWTALLFAAAAAVRLWRAIRERRVFDALVGAFCLFVAGEEVSWGQRLFGFTPPSPFLAHNTQQEFNLHNFAELFGRPKWVLAAALVGFGVLLPLATRAAWGRSLAHRVGATPPPLPLLPWFAACVALLLVYPVEFTGEWIECLAGFLFLASAGVSPAALWGGAAGTLVLAAALSAVSERAGTADPARVACARAEATALLADLTADSVARDRLLEGGTIHKRAWSAAEDGYIELGGATSFASAACAGTAAEDAPARRRYAVDPWGTAYWVKTVRTEDGARSVLVYSFGPNRRRDGDAAETGPSRGDDVVAERTVAPR